MESLLVFTGMEVTQLRLHIILPVGISFYTFQTMSYTIDVYRGLVAPHAQFPGLRPLRGLLSSTRGRVPSNAPRTCYPSLAGGVPSTAISFRKGLQLMLFGFFKKVYVADNLAPLVDQVFSHPNPGGWQVLAGAYAFAIQIYCDFSGYTDIARGLLQVPGYRPDAQLPKPLHRCQSQ